MRGGVEIMSKDWDSTFIVIGLLLLLLAALVLSFFQPTWASTNFAQSLLGILSHALATVVGFLFAKGMSGQNDKNERIEKIENYLKGDEHGG